MSRPKPDSGKSAYAHVRLLGLCALLGVCAGVWVVVAQQTDTDNDGMPDSYETFFGLEATNSADAAFDEDADGLTNLNESLVLTDPFVADTDRDGWNDSVDSNPLSRVYIQWGDLDFTEADNYDYTGPEWWLSAYKIDGEWITNPLAWHVPSTESNSIGRLNITVDRQILTNDTVLQMDFFDHTNAFLYAALADSNEVVVATDLFSNLMTGSNIDVQRKYSVPWAAYPDAMRLILYRFSGENTIYQSLLYIDLDGDGLDADQEKQLGTSDHNPDSDGDGYLDFDETFIYGTDPANPISYPKAQVSGQVSYGGSETGLIRVLVATGSVAWAANWSTSLDQPGSYAVYDIPLLKRVWIRAFRDGNGNGTLDTWEARGNYAMNPVDLTNDLYNVDFALTDPDSDGDGMSDGLELRLGNNPFVSNTFHRLPFVEGFETNTVHLGDLKGQNLWKAAFSNSVFVQTNTVYEGQQAVKVYSGTNEETAVWQDFVASTAQVVWLDFNVQALAGVAPTNGLEQSAAWFYFNEDGRLVVYDGLLQAGNRWQVLTNHSPVSATNWVRITVQMDYLNRHWLICLNGQKLADNLGLTSQEIGLNRLEIDGGQGFMDGIRITSFPPDDLDLDVDNLPDSWEIEHFGNLNQDANGDADHDGLTNGQEFNLGTDPFSADTDGDGAGDLLEIQWNRDPVVADVYAGLPWTSGFETSEGYSAGDLAGQETWVVFAGSAQIETTDVLEGHQAVVAASGANHLASIGRILLAGATPVLWTDYFVKPAIGSLSSNIPARATALYAVSSNGFWMVRDGNVWRTATHQAAVSLGSWAHVAIKENYNTHTWDFYVGADAVFTNLSFADPTVAAPVGFVFNGMAASNMVLDDIRVAATSPGHVDEDGDGLIDADEVFYGTDPLNPDTDQDGMTDGMEVYWGFDPNDPGSFFQMTSQGGTNMWFTGFEPEEGYVTNALNGQNGWSASNRVMIVDGERQAGVQSVLLPSRGGGSGYVQSMEAAIGASGRSSAWIQFYTKSGQGIPEHPELMSGAAIVALEDNFVVAYDGILGKWVASQSRFSPDSNGWTRLDIKMDYDAKRFLVCANGVLALEDINFKDRTIPGLSYINFDGSTADEESDTFIDSLHVFAEEPADQLDYDNDGLSNAEEYELGTKPRSVDTDNDGLTDWEEVRVYLTNPFDADTDHDGIPDLWETSNGFDPNDAADAAQDPDNDGLNNLEEYLNGTDYANGDCDGDGLSDGDEVQQYGTNPNSVDTDSDGMPDAWEIEHSLNPLLSNAGADDDGDRLTNVEEMNLGTDPRSADTDQDGIDDRQEVMALTDPLTADFDGTVADVAVIPGIDTSARFGNWFPLETEIYDINMRGYVEYEVTNTTADIHRVRIDGTQYRNYATNLVYAFNLKVYCDGELLGQDHLWAAHGSYGQAYFYTPYLAPGRHIFRIFWENGVYNTSLQIKEIRVQTLGGMDENNNGVKDWVEHRLAAQCSLETPPQASFVSPVCIEGQGAFLSLLTCERSQNEIDWTPVPVEHGAGYRWYANVPLSQDDPTSIHLEFQSGVVTSTAVVAWARLNLLNGVDQMIRKNDALLFTAVPEGATDGVVNVEIVGKTNLETTLGLPVAYSFDQTGTFTVVGTYIGEIQTNRSIVVRVVDNSWPTVTPAAMIGRERIWDCTGLASEAVVESDERLIVTNGVTLAGGGRRLLLKGSIDDPMYVVARLGEGGPILGSTRVDGMNGYNSDKFRVLEEYPDGSRRIETYLTLNQMPTGLHVKLEMHVSSALFDDGTIYREVGAGDFNQFGEYWYRLIIPPEITHSACHSIRIYQNTVYLGGD